MDGEFTAIEFQRVLAHHGITDNLITAKNPQANEVCERMHHVVGNILRSNKDNIADNVEVEDILDNAIYTCMYALWCAVNHTMQASPGELVYCRNMLMDVPIIAD